MGALAPTKSRLPLARVPPRTHKVWNGSEACPDHQSCTDASSHKTEFVYLWIDFINCFYVIQIFLTAPGNAFTIKFC